MLLFFLIFFRASQFFFFLLLSFTLYFLSVNSRDSKRDVNGFHSSYSAHTYFCFRFINVQAFFPYIYIKYKYNLRIYILFFLKKKLTEDVELEEVERKKKNIRRMTFSSLLMIYCQLFIFHVWLWLFFLPLVCKVVAVNFKSIHFVAFEACLSWRKVCCLFCIIYIKLFIYLILNVIFVLW